jgi:glycine cleavage system H protein
MSLEHPENLRYTDTHEYVDLSGDVATIGVSAFAVDQLGDIVFVELPAVGDKITQGSPFGTIESVKAVEDLKAPISGEVIDRNEATIDAPEKIGEDPYTTGWLLKVRLSNIGELDTLLSGAEYRSRVEGT